MASIHAHFVYHDTDVLQWTSVHHFLVIGEDSGYDIVTAYACIEGVKEKVQLFKYQLLICGIILSEPHHQFVR